MHIYAPVPVGVQVVFMTTQHPNAVVLLLLRYVTLLQDLEIVTDYEFKGNSKSIACSYKSLPASVKKGSVSYTSCFCEYISLS
jgi:hypothetical protein